MLSNQQPQSSGSNNPLPPQALQGPEVRIAELNEIIQWSVEMEKMYEKQLNTPPFPICDMPLITSLDEISEATWEYFQEAQALDYNLAKRFFQVFCRLQTLLTKACHNGLDEASKMQKPNPTVVVYMKALINSSALYQINLFPHSSNELGQLMKDVENYQKEWEIFYKANETHAKKNSHALHFNLQLNQFKDLQQTIYQMNFAHYQLESKIDTDNSSQVDCIRGAIMAAKTLDSICNNGHFNNVITTLQTQFDDVMNNKTITTTKANASIQMSHIMINSIFLRAELEFFQYNRVPIAKKLSPNNAKNLLIFDIDETLAYPDIDTKERVIIARNELKELLIQIDLDEFVVLAMTTRYFPELSSVHFMAIRLLLDIQEEIQKEVFQYALFTSAQSKGPALNLEYQRQRLLHPKLTKAKTVLVDNLQENLDDVKEHDFNGILADFSGTHYDAVHRFFNIPKRGILQNAANTLNIKAGKAKLPKQRLTPSRSI